MRTSTLTTVEMEIGRTTRRCPPNHILVTTPDEFAFVRPCNSMFYCRRRVPGSTAIRLITFDVEESKTARGIARGWARRSMEDVGPLKARAGRRHATRARRSAAKGTQGNTWITPHLPSTLAMDAGNASLSRCKWNSREIVDGSLRYSISRCEEPLQRESLGRPRTKPQIGTQRCSRCVLALPLNLAAL